MTCVKSTHGYVKNSSQNFLHESILTQTQNIFYHVCTVSLFYSSNKVEVLMTEHVSNSEYSRLVFHIRIINFQHILR